MAFGLFITLLLLAFASEKVLSQDRHEIIWDRYWLRDNLTNLTLHVALNDQVAIFCHVDEDTERPEDIAENVVYLQEEKNLTNCDTSQTGESSLLFECLNQGIDHVINIVDSLQLTNRRSFEAGGAYYFTSFSDGTVGSAQQEASRGGACMADPPLRLTISVSATETSFPSPTMTVSEMSTTIISSTMDNVMPTPTVMSTSTSTSSSTTTNPTSEPSELPTPPSVTRDALSGAKLLSPIHSVLLLVPLFTCIMIL